MGPCYANGFWFFAFHLDVNVAIKYDWELILTDLVPLGEVGVEIIFAGKYGTPSDGGVNSQPKFDRHVYGFFIQNGQNTGQA